MKVLISVVILLVLLVSLIKIVSNKNYYDEEMEQRFKKERFNAEKKQTTDVEWHE